MCSLNSRPLQPLTNGTIDIAAFDKWAIPYPWVTDIQPLTARERQQYPWNWEWNLNWLRGKDIWNLDLPKIQALQEFRVAERQYYIDTNTRHFFLRLINEGKLSQREMETIQLPGAPNAPKFIWDQPPIYL
jgi:hypothetical protein